MPTPQQGTASNCLYPPSTWDGADASDLAESQPTHDQGVGAATATLQPFRSNRFKEKG